MKRIMQLCRCLIIVAFFATAATSQAQELQEGWYQIKREMSATEVEKQLKKIDISSIGTFFKNLISNEYLYVEDESTHKQKFLGIEYGQRTYGAQYVSTDTVKINNGNINTYFYVTPVEGETEAYTIRSYNGHYLHSDGTFSINPETLFLGKAIDINAEGTKSGIAGIAGNTIAFLINGAVALMNINGYSVGKPSTSYDLDLSKLAGTVDGLVDPGFKITTSYKEMSWQQSVTEVTDAEGNTTIKYGDYMDGKKSDIGNIGLTLAKDLLSGELKANDALSIIRFIMRNFCSDAYSFHKVNLKAVNSGDRGVIGSAFAGELVELVPYTVQIEGWDGTFKVNDPSDYASTDLLKSNQLTHTNASVIIESDATLEKYTSSPIYNGGTIFANKEFKLGGNGEESSFIDLGDHGCSNVVITPFNYNNGVLGFGANGVQDFSKCISAACVDEANHIIHVYFTEPGKQWKVAVKEGKMITRNAPFALKIPDAKTEGIFSKKTYRADAYIATAVNGEDVAITKLDSRTIPAHTGVLIKNGDGCEDADRTYNFTVASKDDQATEAPAGNLLHGVCFGFDLDADVNAYVLKTLNGTQKFYKLNQDDRKLAPWRAYLQFDNAAASTLRISGLDEGLLEGIESVESEGSFAPSYDLNGRRADRTNNGVIISAGKKYIAK